MRASYDHVLPEGEKDEATEQNFAVEPPPPESWPEPVPLPSGLPGVAPFEPELLPAAFRPWIEDISDRIQCPPDFPAVGAMVGLASIVGRRCAIKPKRQDDWLVVPNLWGGAIGRPGVLKTPPLEEIKKPLDRLEIAARKEHEEDLSKWQANEIIAKYCLLALPGAPKPIVMDPRSGRATASATSVCFDNASFAASIPLRYCSCLTLNSGSPPSAASRILSVRAKPGCGPNTAYFASPTRSRLLRFRMSDTPSRAQRPTSSARRETSGGSSPLTGPLGGLIVASEPAAGWSDSSGLWA